MMKFSAILVSALVAAAAASAAKEEPTTNHFATCPVVPVVPDAGKYHSDAVCDRANFNSFKCSLNRAAQVKRLQATGSYRHVPVSKTVLCPEHVEALHETDQVDGFDTMWIVENTASTSVVLAYTKEVNGLPVEYSAIHPEVSPPQADPDAIMVPGSWRAVYAYEGHVFHARELDETTGQAGRVLLQHRVGLIPVGGNFEGELSCPDVDEEPVVKTENKTVVRHPKFQRTPTAVNRPCNTVDIGFRNMASCPLHGYYVRHLGEPTEAGCNVEEVFKYHLGASRLNPIASDFMWQWQSTQKYEGSFMGHSFTFRLAANPEVLVDRVTLEPTRIIDCPNLSKQTVTVGIRSGAQAIVVPTGDVTYNGNSGGRTNSTQVYEGLVLGNYTLTKQQQLLAERRRGGGVSGAAAAAAAALGGIVSF